MAERKKNPGLGKGNGLEKTSCTILSQVFKSALSNSRFKYVIAIQTYATFLMSISPFQRRQKYSRSVPK